MHTPSSDELVRVWELGHQQPTWYRGLLMLVPLLPKYSLRELGELSLGTRNTWLFALRRSLFGSNIDGGVRCERCGEALQFSLRVEDLCPLDDVALNDPEPPRRYRYEIDGNVLELRAPSSRDLAPFAPATPSRQAARSLMQRTIRILEPEHVRVEDLAADIVDAAIDRIIEEDPLVESWLALQCQDCGHEWSALLDIASYLWSEVSTSAERSLNEVALLAREYGWREEDIFAMPSARRTFYLSHVTAQAGLSEN